MEIEKPKTWDQITKIHQKLQGVVYVECILCHGVYPKYECKFSLDEKENVNAICGRCERENRVIPSQEIGIKINEEVIDKMCDDFQKESERALKYDKARKVREEQKEIEEMMSRSVACRPQQAQEQAHYEALARQLEEMSARMQLKVHRLQEALLGPEPRGKEGEGKVIMIVKWEGK